MCPTSLSISGVWKNYISLLLQNGQCFFGESKISKDKLCRLLVDQINASKKILKVISASDQKSFQDFVNFIDVKYQNEKKSVCMSFSNFEEMSENLSIQDEEVQSQLKEQFCKLSSLQPGLSVEFKKWENNLFKVAESCQTKREERFQLLSVPSEIKDVKSISKSNEEDSINFYFKNSNQFDVFRSSLNTRSQKSGDQESIVFDFGNEQSSKHFPPK